MCESKPRKGEGEQGRQKSQFLKPSHALNPTVETLKAMTQILQMETGTPETQTTTLVVHGCMLTALLLAVLSLHGYHSA